VPRCSHSDERPRSSRRDLQGLKASIDEQVLNVLPGPALVTKPDRVRSPVTFDAFPLFIDVLSGCKPRITIDNAVDLDVLDQKFDFTELTE
jgi:hypothetical protein